MGAKCQVIEMNRFGSINERFFRLEKKFRCLEHGLTFGDHCGCPYDKFTLHLDAVFGMHLRKQPEQHIRLKPEPVNFEPKNSLLTLKEVGRGEVRNASVFSREAASERSHG